MKRAFAAAKINLALHVLGQRSDGYHEIESLVAFVDIGDTITAEIAPLDAVLVSGEFGDVLGAGEANLVELAVAKFRARFPDAIAHGLSINLEKNLPIGSGIGGGSADAAATLRLLNSYASTAIPQTQLMELALELGADVPVCLNEKPTLMRGIGQILEPAPQPPACGVLLINPRRQISTPQVFKQMTSRNNQGLPDLPAKWTDRDQFVAWLENTRNDLAETAMAIEPEISEIVDFAGAREGVLFVRMSGSGATVCALFETDILAECAAVELSKKWPDFWIKTGRFLPA